MSNSREPSIISTPSKHKTAARSASQIANNKVKEIHDDIAYDVDKAKKASFDTFLRLFLSRCLTGDDKDDFEALQQRIEKLQIERYNDAALRQTTRDALEETQGQASADGDNPAPASAEEIDLVGARDKLLNGVVDKCLSKVLGLAKDDEMQALLRTFTKLIKSKSLETARYEPYGKLYNHAMDELAKIPNLPLCTPAPHRLRLSRADPCPITSSFSGTGENLERKPDFVRTSMSAAKFVHNGSESGLGRKPANAFQWSQVLSCEEMKAFKGSISAPAEAIANGKKLDFVVESAEDRKKQEVPWNKQFMFSAQNPETVSSAMSSTRSGSKRDRSEALGEGTTSNKKARLDSITVSSTGADRVPLSSEKDTLKNVDARVQVATYAMEMLSFGPGVVHVINTLVVDEVLYIWYYDRQGIIRSDGISIIGDFPRFLVLLLAFQRFSVEDWGIVPCLNPKALIHLGIEEHPDPAARQRPCPSVHEINLSLGGAHFRGAPRVISDMNPREGPLVIKAQEYLSHQPHGISGRATSVFKAVHDQKALACKISSPEVQRPHEGDTLRVVHAISEAKEPSMLRHLPTFYFSGDLQAGNTLRARSILGICGKGYRALRVVVLEELVPLTSQTGESFVNAWLDGVTCHAFLWKHGVEHSDPSLWNVMYHPIQKCGVLTDFDLAVVAWRKRVPGTDRTGTIPFMALELLRDRYWQGKITRHYHHELEAFIWMLPFVFLAYENGKFQPQARFIKDWITSDYNACRLAKADFASNELDIVRDFVTSTFKPYNRLLLQTCRMVRNQHNMRRQEVEDLVLQEIDAEGGVISPPPPHIGHSAAMWDGFVSILSQSGIDTNRLKKHKPIFDRAQSQDLFKEMEAISDSLRFPG